MDTDVIYQGARAAVGAFFIYGAKTLAPPPELNSSRAMLAAFLVTMALALWVTIEQLAASKLLDPLRKRTIKKPQRRLRNPAGNVLFSLARDILFALGIATTSRDGIGRNHSRRRRR